MTDTTKQWLVFVISLLAVVAYFILAVTLPDAYWVWLVLLPIALLINAGQFYLLRSGRP